MTHPVAENVGIPIPAEEGKGAATDKEARAQAVAALSVGPDRIALPNELLILRSSALFWAGLVLKLGCALAFGSHFATRFFAPFLHAFVRNPLSDPWQASLTAGEPLAFPYGPGMLLLLAIPWWPAGLASSFDPTSPLGLLLLRLPLLAADLLICLILMRWLRTRSQAAIAAYWLNPIVIYATYIHGQLDLIPTALLCASFALLFARRIWQAALVFGVALATKSHLLLAFPFALIYLFRLPRRGGTWLRFGVIASATAALLYALPVTSAAFREMVFGSAESRKIWSVGLVYATSVAGAAGTGLMLYLAPAALLVGLFRFAGFCKLNRELTLMFLGVLYVVLVVLVPPQPGWFIWSAPFIAYLGGQFSRTGRFALPLLAGAYLLYFFIGDPTVFLESVDPLLGWGTGATWAGVLRSRMPGFFDVHAASVAWTLLCAATMLTAYEMYRRGVRSNAVYGFRDESFMMGIGGDSAAGKHTLGRDLEALIGSRISIINGDDDHKWERGDARWSIYTHLDPRSNLLGLQRESLEALRRGGDVRKAHYDHGNGRFTAPQLTRPNDFVAIIGLHPFYTAAQRSILHLKVFVDPEEDLRRAWKVARDVAKRGYTAERVIAQIEQRTADGQKYVRPQMRYADLVLRHAHKGTKAPTDVALALELSSELDPLVLLEALHQVPSLAIQWEPNEDLTRDRLLIEGTIDASMVQTLATVVVPNLEELVGSDAWHPGGRGLAQLAVIYSMSARLRGRAASAPVDEAAAS